jgi:hypothetical protein
MPVLNSSTAIFITGFKTTLLAASADSSSIVIVRES